MTKRELTPEEKDAVHFYAETVNAYQHNARMLQGKYISDKQAANEYLDIAPEGASREKFLAGKKAVQDGKS